MLSSNDPLARKLYVSPNIFFILRDGHIIAWDYKNHQQFELESRYFQRLIELSSANSSINSNEVDSELLEAGLISETNEETKWEWDILSHIFHYGTSISTSDGLSSLFEPENFIEDYLNHCKNTYLANDLIESDLKLPKIPLPPADLDLLANINFLSVLKNRRTCRSFIKKSLSINLLSTMLYSVFGDFHTSTEEYKKYGFEKIGMRKTSPSGGGLHLTEAYLVAKDVDGLKKGIYSYSPLDHSLILINEYKQNQNLSEFLCGQYFADELPFGIFLTSRFDKLWKKYPHSRAYRIALFDVGHISQTFHLISTALGLNSWLSGAFEDDKVATLLNLTTPSERVVFFVGAGYGDGFAIDKIARHLNNKG